MIDPRQAVVERRLGGVRRVVAFCSAKGGVGKTLCAAISALTLAGAGRRTGLLDLDFQGASAHLVLGVQPRFPEEKEGILPLPAADRLWLMSAAAFTGERALPLRGPDVTNAILELVAVTRWGDLDYLLVDMPPGIGDGILDLIAFVPRLETLVVSTPSVVSVSVVERLVRLLRESRVPVSGVIANMCVDGAGGVREMALRRGVSFAGEVPFYPAVEKAVGSPAVLVRGPLAAALGAALAEAGIR